MEVIVLPTAREVGIAAAGIIARLVAAKPDAVLGLATGASVKPVYEELKAVDFSRVTTFNLDEYVGLSPSHPASLRAFMDAHLFSRVDIDRRRTHFPPTGGDDLVHRRAHEQQQQQAGRDQPRQNTDQALAHRPDDLSRKAATGS